MKLRPDRDRIDYMNILAIDLGSYSVKISEFHLERKALVLDNHAEYVLSESADDSATENDDEKKDANTALNLEMAHEQHQIIKDYIAKNNFDGKIVFQYPQHLTTSRYLSLPVAHRKKAEQMLPFLLEENLPFPINRAHFTSELFIKNKATFAIVNITHMDQFEAWYESMDQKNITPHLLTSELSLMQSLVEQNRIDGPACILDLGHKTSKAYFIYNRNIVSNHVSHIAGHTINEVISQTYKISYEESVIYKHQNCFFLTDTQYEEVEHDQLEFAKMMKQAVEPLILEMKRWMLGYRVQYINPILKVYITGGTTQISNITNFLAAELGLKVEKLKIFNDSDIHQVEIKDKSVSSYFLCQIIGLSTFAKTQAANFLRGQYAKNSAGSFPLYSTAFIFSRVAMVALVLSVALIIERFYLSSTHNTLTEALYVMLKGESLGMPPKEQRNFKREPTQTLNYLIKQNSSAMKAITAIKNSQRFLALADLAFVGQQIGNNPGVVLESYKNNNGATSLKFSSTALADLNKIENSFSAMDLEDFNDSLDKEAKTLNLEYTKE